MKNINLDEVLKPITVTIGDKTLQLKKVGTMTPWDTAKVKRKGSRVEELSLKTEPTDAETAEMKALTSEIADVIVVGGRRDLTDDECWQVSLFSISPEYAQARTGADQA